MRHQLPSPQRDRLLHQRSNWELIRPEEEIPNQRNIASLPRRLDDLADRVPGISFTHQRSHRGVYSRVGAAEPARFNAPIETHRLNLENVIRDISVLGHIDESSAVLLGKRETVGVFIDRTGLLRPSEQRQAHDGQPNRSTAPDTHHSPLLHVRKLTSMPRRVSDIRQGQKLRRRHTRIGYINHAGSR